MLSQENRFSLKTDRVRLETTGKTTYSSFFTIISAPRTDSDSPIRFALLISKKSLPLSVARHQLKRRLTEILRLNLDKLGKGKDIILIPKRSIQTATNDAILTDLVNATSNHESSH